MKLCTLLPLASLALFVAPVLTTAQGVPTGLPNVFNPASQVPGTAGMTPAQAQRAQQVWQLRALQSRGGQNGQSGPKRGTPQIFGSYGGQPGMNPQTVQQAPAKPTSQQKAAQRRAEAKAEIEQRKQSLRAAAEQKKQLNAKN